MHVPSRRAIRLAVLLALTACRGSSDSPIREDPHPLPGGALQLEVSCDFGGSLRYPLPGEPQTFNPLMVTDTRSLVVVRMSSATLLEWDPAAQTVRDGLTTARRLSADGRTLELDLRRDVRFSDGTPMTASDVVFSAEKIFTAGSASALRQGLSLSGEPLAVRQLDSHRVAVELPRPTPAAEYMLTSLPVLPRHRFAGVDGPLDDHWTVGTAPSEMAGLGPFVVSAHEPGLHTTLAANPHYWKTDREGRRMPCVDEVVLEHVEDRNAQLLRFQSAELDILDQLLRPEDLEFLQSAGEGIETEDLGPSGNLTFLWFNLTRPRAGQDVPLKAAARSWFEDSRFRRAISRAINRQAIVDNIFGGRATAARTLVPRSAPRWHLAELEAVADEADAALGLLLEAGFRQRRDGGQPQLVDSRGRPVAFELLVKSDEVLGRTAAVVQQDLARLGIHVTIQQEEMRSIISRVMGSRNYEAVLTNLDLTFDPSDFDVIFRSSGPMHLWDAGSPDPQVEWQQELDDAMRALSEAADDGARVASFSEAQRIVAREAPIIPLVNRNVLLAWHQHVRNLRPANQFPYTLWNSWEIAIRH